MTFSSSLPPTCLFCTRSLLSHVSLDLMLLSPSGDRRGSQRLFVMVSDNSRIGLKYKQKITARARIIYPE
ncbi:hypothetical protein SDJN02_00262, partial [Cucurbita argyrosperma subsp. argyrosperma]